MGFFHIFHIFLLFNLPFFHIFPIFSLFDSLFKIFSLFNLLFFHSFSLFNLPFFHIYKSNIAGLIIVAESTYRSRAPDSFWVFWEVCVVNVVFTPLLFYKRGHDLSMHLFTYTGVQHDFHFT
jgi:hypothetical protein